ncbi:hypothetical protein ATN84_01735 [Paramesorhizobium deserti]|uniref:Uncharacterized protein n=1 Tax=Paramesorhizobium deserti TaxID=1494590 RepID=A0A135HZC9_9HYPH|nr:hypothetical protein [Paramesorhizobium deserti]KXF78539.1 hypothetical protein ATN84_01735 [Paramesorhizobium deserti]
MDIKETARTAMHTLTRAMLTAGIPAAEVADTLICQALAIYSVATGRHAAADALLEVWGEERMHGN